MPESQFHHVILSALGVTESSGSTPSLCSAVWSQLQRRNFVGIAWWPDIRHASIEARVYEFVERIFTGTLWVFIGCVFWLPRCGTRHWRFRSHIPWFCSVT